MPKISILIPVFNAEKHFRECLESVKNQTFCDWECIVANDGSTDESVQIANEFVNSDHRFKLFSAKHLGNPQYVRDFARLQTSGDWFFNLDADDFLDPNCLEKLVERQKQTHADIVLLQLNLFDDRTQKIIQKIPNSSFDFSQIISGSDAAMKTFENWEIPANGLFQKNLFNFQNTISNDVLNLDEYMSRAVLFNAKTVAFSDASYFYRQHETSLTKKISEAVFSVIHTDKLLENLVKSHFGENSTEAQKVYNTALKHLLHRYTYFFQNQNRFSNDEQHRIQTLFSNAFSELSKRKIWRSDLSVLKKFILIFPPKIISWFACIYARYKRP
jgi:glycosyltransferase involved in cell wall biosynthesis